MNDILIRDVRGESVCGRGTDKNTVKVALDVQEILSRSVCVSKVRSFQKIAFI